MAVVSQPDIWNSVGIAYADAAISIDATGGLGGTLVEGGATEFPSLDLLIADTVTGPPPSWSLTQVAAGTADNAATYGGYLGATPDSVFTNTFLIAGEVDQNGSVVPDFTWFGRHSNAPIDLSGTFITSPAVAQGQSVTLNFSAQNTEVGDADQPLVDFYLTNQTTVSLSTPLAGTPSVLLVDSMNLPVIPGNSTSPVETVTITLPAPTDPFWAANPPGSNGYRIVAIVNPTGLLPEADLTNNANLGIGIDQALLNFPPVINAPSTAAVTDGQTLSFGGASAISITDVSGTAEQMTLTVLHGTLTLGTTTGLTVSGKGTSSLVASGPLASLNTDLASLVYTPKSGFAGSDTLSLFDTDTADGLTATPVDVAITVLPGQSSSGQSSQSSTNFTADTAASGPFEPASPSAGVGNNEIVLFDNDDYQVFSESGGTLLQSFSLNQFWDNALPSTSQLAAGDYAFDPHVVFDPTTGLWYASAVDWGNAPTPTSPANEPNNFLVAVSKTDDPTQGWTAFIVSSNYPATTPVSRADFDTLGFNSQSLVVTANMYDSTTGSSLVDRAVLSIPLADLTPTTTQSTFNGALTLDYTLSTTGANNTFDAALDYDSTPNETLLRRAPTASRCSCKRLPGEVPGTQP